MLGIWLVFFLFPNYNFYKENELTNDCDPIEKNEGRNGIQCEKFCKNHLLCIWKDFVC